MVDYLEYLQKTSLPLLITPPLLSGLIQLAFILAVPDIALKQWLFYMTRPLFVAFFAIYVYVIYKTTDDPTYHLHLARKKKAALFFGFVFLASAIEDTFMLVVWNPDIQSSQFLYYMSERNFSENFGFIIFSILCLRDAAKTLRLRYYEPPTSDSSSYARTWADNQMQTYARVHGLTPREKEILGYVIDGLDNRNIASELQLSVGAVKTHVHNICKKANKTSRDSLIRDFWRG